MSDITQAQPVTNTMRVCVEAAVETLLALLDEMDPDPELEDDITEENGDEDDCNMAGCHTDLEFDDSYGDEPGYIWGGQGA